MNKRPSLIALPALLAVLASLSGCRRDTPESFPPEVVPASAPTEAAMPEPDEAMPEEDPVYALMARVESKIDAGLADEAKTLLTEALAEPEFALHRPRVFYMTLAMLLMMDEVAEAQSHMHAMLQADMELARESIGIISEHLLMRDDHAGALAWTEDLLGFNLPEPTRHAVLNWRLQALLLRVLDRTLEDPAASAVARRAHRHVSTDTFADTLLRAVPAEQRLAALSQARDMLGADVPAAEDWEPLREELTIRSALLQQDWEPATGRMTAARQWLSDATMQRLLRAAVAEMTQAGTLTSIDTLCEQLMTLAETHPRTAQAATYQWVRNAVQQARFEAVPDRIETLMDRDAEPLLLHGLYNRHFYDIVAHPQVVARMLTIADRLLPMLTDERHQQSLRILALDGSFVTQDYDRTIALLETGIPGRDAAWHALALTKVMAHRAMDRNEPLEAVNHLRAFMEAVRQSPEESTADPSTGVVHTRSMILGRNARRIGDLLTQAGDTTGARTAYDEARALYDQALEELDADSPSAELAGTEKAEIP